MTHVKIGMIFLLQLNEYVKRLWQYWRSRWKQKKPLVEGESSCWSTAEPKVVRLTKKKKIKKKSWILSYNWIGAKIKQMAIQANFLGDKATWQLPLLPMTQMYCSVTERQCLDLKLAVLNLRSCWRRRLIAVNYDCDYHAWELQVVKKFVIKLPWKMVVIETRTVLVSLQSRPA